MVRTNQGNSSDRSPDLKRQLTLPQVIAMAAGGMISAWMIEIKYWFELSGVGSALALALCAFLVLFLAEIYSEMTAMLPYAGGSTVWTSNAFGWDAGWFAGWFLVLLYIMAMPTVTYGIAGMLGYFFELSFIQTKLIALVIIVAWFFFSNVEIKFIARFQNVIFWLTTIVSVLASLIFIFSSEWSINTMKPIFPNGWSGFLLAVGVLIFKFIGFDMVPQMAEEANFPRSKVRGAYVGAILLTLLVYGLAIIGVGGIVSRDWIIQVDIVDPRVADLLDMHWLAIVLVVLGIITSLTTLPGFWMSASRVIYSGARQRQYPAFFGRTNKNGQPVQANLLVAILSIFFTVFAPENWVNYIYSIYGLTAGLVYLSAVLSFIKLRKTHPEWERPYRVKYPRLVSVVSLIFIAWVFLATLYEMTLGGIVTLIIYLLIGLVLWLYARQMQKKHPETWAPYIIKPSSEEISEEETL